MGTCGVDDLTLRWKSRENLWFSRTGNGAGKIHDNEHICRIRRNERRGEDQRSRYFADPQEAKMRGVFAGDTAALYGDDGAEYLDFRGRAERSDKKVRKTQTEEIMELTHTKEVVRADPQSLKGYRQRVGFATGDRPWGIRMSLY